MAGRARHLLTTAAFLAALLACAPRPLLAAGTGDAEADSLAEAWEEEVESQRGWLSRTLHRFFGRAPQSGEELSGRAEQSLDPFAEFAGRTIEVVIVQPVLRFDPAVADSSSSAAWLSSLARRVTSYTHESIIRQYLLFASNDELDPYELADSERMLRQLSYINDARLVVLPVGGVGDGVAVIVEYRDRWPYGVSGTIITEDRYDVSFYTQNLGGAGVLFDNKIIRNNNGDPATGYRGRLAKGNLGGTFIDVAVEYEDSWQEQDFRVGFDRREVHPQIRYVGGVSWQKRDDRENEGKDEPRVFEQSRAWAGRVFQLSRDPTLRTGLRRALTPALSYARRWFSDRPGVAADSNRSYHHSQTWLGALTYQRITDYKISYLFQMGEVEDIPAGFSAQMSAGYDDGEYLNRTSGWLDFGGSVVRERGDVLMGTAACGGYLRKDGFEDGLFDVVGAYFTPLLGKGRYRHRTFFRFRYTYGINRTTEGGLQLGRAANYRSIESPGVRGNQRYMATVEFRLFTPWRLFGFHVMSFGFADVGGVGASKDPIFEQKVYSSLGMGVRVQNPDLVLPSFEFRFAVTQNVDGRSFAVGLDLGNMVVPELRLPGVRPTKASFR